MGGKQEKSIDKYVEKLYNTDTSERTDKVHDIDFEICFSEFKYAGKEVRTTRSINY